MRLLSAALAASLALTLPAAASGPAKAAPSPGEIAAAAPRVDWVAIPPSDLLVMSLAPGHDGDQRQVIIQLMPPPFSQGWVGNIRKLAAAHWWDGLAITRVQDNYVVQWGDPDAEDNAKAKPLPAGLTTVPQRDYESSDLLSIPDPRGRPRINYTLGATIMRNAMISATGGVQVPAGLEEAIKNPQAPPPKWMEPKVGDAYAPVASLALGWPIAGSMGKGGNKFWPVHCYGMVGVGRNYSPDTGSGAELYAVIGHAPRHLDRNIALVGRVVEGIEHLSSLPRGTGPLGFYEKPEQRVPIQSIRLASELPLADQPRFEYLSTESESFAKYADARANRRDPFFIVPAGGADICNIPVPVRKVR